MWLKIQDLIHNGLSYFLNLGIGICCAKVKAFIYGDRSDGRRQIFNTDNIVSVVDGIDRPIEILWDSCFCLILILPDSCCIIFKSLTLKTQKNSNAQSK